MNVPGSQYQFSGQLVSDLYLIIDNRDHKCHINENEGTAHNCCRLLTRVAVQIIKCFEGGFQLLTACQLSLPGTKIHHFVPCLLFLTWEFGGDGTGCSAIIYCPGKVAWREGGSFVRCTEALEIGWQLIKID